MIIKYTLFHLKSINIQLNQQNFNNETFINTINKHQ